VIFTELSLPGAFIIQTQSHKDDRGSFARTFCRDEFELRGLDPCVAQCSLSRNERTGTLRGLHFQANPFGEAKLVRCSRGAIYDVIVDLRRQSPTHGKWAGVTLSGANGVMLYVPAGFAHGFQTLEDDTEVCYQMSTPYLPELARGIRWNDPALKITWPSRDPILSDRDRELPLLAELPAPKGASRRRNLAAHRELQLLNR
jgi:dTDP-4-dehydrorhamnose 3,5-epimerase